MGPEFIRSESGARVKGAFLSEELTFTEWSVENLTDFHVTFGSVSPDIC